MSCLLCQPLNPVALVHCDGCIAQRCEVMTRGGAKFAVPLTVMGLSGSAAHKPAVHTQAAGEVGNAGPVGDECLFVNSRGLAAGLLQRQTSGILQFGMSIPRRNLGADFGPRTDIARRPPHINLRPPARRQQQPLRVLPRVLRHKLYVRFVRHLILCKGAPNGRNKPPVGAFLPFFAPNVPVFITLGAL